MSVSYFLPVYLQVAGVVGRAETLSSVFFLLALLFYSHASKKKKLTSTSRKNVALAFIYYDKLRFAVGKKKKSRFIYAAPQAPLK